MLVLFLGAILGWLLGLAGYALVLAVVYGERLGSLGPIAALTGGAAAVAFPLVYLPAFAWLRRRLGGVRRAYLFPLLAVPLGLAPTALALGAALAAYGGWSVRGQDLAAALLTTEALLFFAWFAIAGIAFGIAYARTHRAPAG